MTNHEKSIFISAGEKSGDLHASGLVHEMKNLGRGLRFRFAGPGGDLMRGEGVELLFHVNELTTSGITGVIKKYKYFQNVLKSCVGYVRENRPDVIILVDFPGFNLRFAEAVREFYRGKIIYYISPQVWAWHRSRVFKIKKNIDRMLVVFPFEKIFYEQYGVPALYVGHPLVKRLRRFLAANQKRTDDESAPRKIAILPGSRNEEIEHHLPVLLKTAEILTKEWGVHVQFHASDSVDSKVFDKHRKELEQFGVAAGDVYRLILDSDLVITKAGTSTVECALIGTPFIIFYRTSPINYHLIKPMVTLKNMGMVNILAGKNIIREFIQKDFTPQAIVEESGRILNNAEYRNKMKANMRDIWKILGDDDACENAAKEVLSHIN